MSQGSKRWLKRHLAKLVVSVWVLASMAVSATLMAGHWSTLPQPASEDPVLRGGLAELRPRGFEGLAVAHFLYVDCRCSENILEHLVEAPRPVGVYETVVLVGDDDRFQARAEGAGFEVVVVTPEELVSRFGVTATPLFAVTDRTNTVRYRGGYTERKQGIAVRDVAIIKRLANEDKVTALPLFGCATSLELQEILDPLGIKY